MPVCIVMRAVCFRKPMITWVAGRTESKTSPEWITRSTSRSRIASTALLYASCTSTSRWLRLVLGQSFAYRVYPRCVSEMCAILTMSFLLARHRYSTHHRKILGERQECCFLFGMETLYGDKTFSQQSGGICHRAVALADPDHLRRRSQQQTALVEIRIFRDDGVPVLGGVVPDLGIARPVHVEIVNVRALRIH